MKVKVGADTIAEMGVPLSGGGLVAEMVSDPSKLASFGFPQEVIDRAHTLAEQLDEGVAPEFPVIRVEEGWSNNKNLWDAETLDSIAEQTNELEPVGHLGHIPDSQVNSALPEPQTTWVGAITKDEPSRQRKSKGKMVRAIYLAGFNLPGAKVRDFIKGRAVRGVSWYGPGDRIPIPGKGFKIKNFRLMHIDWARKGVEGMPSSRVVAIAKEQEEVPVAEKSLAQVSPEEFKAENPNGYDLLVREAVAEKDDKIAEMQDKLDAAEDDKKLLGDIREALKIDADSSPLEKIGNLMKRLGEKAKQQVEDALDAVLAEKVADEDTRQLVKRLMPVAEMESKAGDLTEDDSVEDLVAEMVTAAFDGDEVVQQFVSEQSSTPIVKRRTQLHNLSEVEKAVKDQGVEVTAVTL